MFGPDLALRWPPEVFAAEVTELTRLAGGIENWTERVELVLEDAFAGPAAADKFRSFVGWVCSPDLAPLGRVVLVGFGPT